VVFISTKGKEAQLLDGIGAKIAKKIDEILSSGELKKLNEELSDEKTKAIILLNRFALTI
jgi:DNA polymerase beta